MVEKNARPAGSHDPPVARHYGRRERYGSLDDRAAWLAGVLRERLVFYLPGSRLPSERALQQTFGVSLRVARRAIELLQQEGVVRSISGKGAVVSRPPTAGRLTRVLAVVSEASREQSVVQQTILLGAARRCEAAGIGFDSVRTDAAARSLAVAPPAGPGEVAGSQPGLQGAALGSASAGPPAQGDLLAAGRLITTIERLARRQSTDAERVGYLFISYAPPANVLRAWALQRLPVALAGASAAGLVDCALTAARLASHSATRRLHLLGHRRIALAQWEGADPQSSDHREGFALAHKALAMPLADSAVWAVSSADQIIRRLREPGRPTAIVAADQRLAGEVLVASSRLGLAVPDELSVIALGLWQRDIPDDLRQRIACVCEGAPDALGYDAVELLLSAASAAGPRCLVRPLEPIEGETLSAPPLHERPAAPPSPPPTSTIL